MFTESQSTSNIELIENQQTKALENDERSHNVSLGPDTLPPQGVRPPDEFDEHEPPEVGHLKAVDVFGFIVNKMIGTGIYTNPVLVLNLTGSRSAAIAFWSIGVAYTLVSMFIYLSYASVIPYNTGELVYLDEVTSHEGRTAPSSLMTPLKRWLRRYLGNGLFAYTLYAFLFIATFNSATNCIQIAQQLLITIRREDQLPEPSILRFIATVTLSIVCLFHYFTPAVGRALNVSFAFVKIGLLLAIIFAGCYLWSRQKTIATFYESETVGSSNYAKALLLIIFAFEGWENANFVAGELPRDSHHVFRRGFLWAVIVVSILYIAINVLFLFVLVEYPHNDGTTQVGSGLSVAAGTSIAPLFFGNTTAAIKCWGVLTAFSALGSVISVVYTFAHVKQAIGRMNIIPWSSFWGADDKQWHHTVTGDLEKTPMGGLILHWITTVVAIAATTRISNLINAIFFPGIVQAYAHTFFLIPLSLGFLRIRSRATALGFQHDNLHDTDRFLTTIWSSPGYGVLSIRIVVILAYVACNAFLIVNYVIPPQNAVAGWIPPTIVGSVLSFATVYYFSLFGSFLPDPEADVPNDGEEIGSDARDGPGKVQWSLLRLADVKMRIVKANAYDESTPRARRFGTRRKITYHDGPNANFLYWIFGGKLHRTPWDKFRARWNRLTSWS